jgi:uncharacterized membrane protein YgcG
MLAADKLQLQSQIKQSATALKEKEFNLHVSNMMTVGTQAAVLAGLDITMFIEFHPAELDEFAHPNVARALLFVYYGLIVGAFCSNVVVVSHTTTLSVLGGGLALRGPDGSMMTATDSLYRERSSVFSTFGMGLSLTMGSVLVGVWIILHWETALLCCCVALAASRTIWKNYNRVRVAFQYNEDETVDLRDLFEGVAGIQAIPTRLRPSRGKALLSTSKASTLSADDDDENEDDDDGDDDNSEEDDMELGESFYGSSGGRTGAGGGSSSGGGRQRRGGQMSALLADSSRKPNGPAHVKRRNNNISNSMAKSDSSKNSKNLKSILTV